MDRQRNKYTRFAWAGGTSHASRGLEEPEKKVLVVCLAGARSLLRPECYYDRKKKSSSIVFGVTYILSVQCTVVLLCQFFGCSGN